MYVCAASWWAVVLTFFFFAASDDRKAQEEPEVGSAQGWDTAWYYLMGEVRHLRNLDSGVVIAVL